MSCATHFRKFDGTLRMVLSATEAQRTALVAWLEARHRAGELAYGLHIAKEALVTCLIFELGKWSRRVRLSPGMSGHVQAAGNRGQYQGDAAAAACQAQKTTKTPKNNMK